jgi:ornithine carbamoyltransferase
MHIMKRDLVSLTLWSTAELSGLLTLAHTMKKEREGPLPLSRRSVALIFEKESLRTRVAFEVGIAELGGHPIFLQQSDIGLATRESVNDIARTLSGYCTAIVARTSRHQTCVQLAESASVPVVNAMTDLVHPCQILADAMTLQELGRFSPTTRIVYLGEGNNMANSWLELAEKFPLHLTFSCPAGFEPHPQILAQAQAAGVSTISFVPDPNAAVEGADVVSTDLWPTANMETGRRLNLFRPYQINKELMRRAHPECAVLHRLPAHRGEEITSEVLDGRHSAAIQEAENRIHIHKAILSTLLNTA